MLLLGRLGLGGRGGRGEAEGAGDGDPPVEGGVECLVWVLVFGVGGVGGCQCMYVHTYIHTHINHSYTNTHIHIDYTHTHISIFIYQKIVPASAPRAPGSAPPGGSS